jgi:cytoskeletal protein RodZ
VPEIGENGMKLVAVLVILLGILLVTACGAAAGAAPSASVTAPSTSEVSQTVEVLSTVTTLEEATTTGATGATASTTGSTAGATISSTASSTMSSTASGRVDRHDPESVLRAYFAAWRNGHWEEEASYMAPMFAHMVPEPVKTLDIVDLEQIDKSTSQCDYSVSFEFVPAGDPVSMDAGHYDWTYELKWDAGRQSWIITNYGAG